MKNIVICCDGTDNQFNEDNTNVVRLYQCIEKHNSKQVAFYDPGVGTFSSNVFGFKLGSVIGKLFGSAFGYGVRTNIADAYRYLMSTFEDGDKVFIFGFSRGAFTARCLASMLDKCGLLFPKHENMIPYAVEQALNHKYGKEVQEFRQTFSRACTPYFVGVWDTVGSLGAILSWYRFKNMALSPSVSVAVQALSIDEKRIKFPPTLWDEETVKSHQSVTQEWFSGVHCDVGGGYKERGLSDITLEWMLKHAASQGLRLEPKTYERINGNPLGTLHKSYKGFWYILGARVRRLPDNAKVHSSVWERWRQDPQYRPKNLKHLAPDNR